jgi:uncharacterized secreted protein with C-terminal beta-propeller domain
MFIQSITRKIILIFFLLLAVVLGYLIMENYRSDYSFIDQNNPIRRKATGGGIVKFTSEKEFKDYLAKAGASRTGIGRGGGMESLSARNLAAPTAEKAMDMDNISTNQALGIGGGGAGPQRVSETNAQVLTIDEPDIVKTNGKEIYFSKQEYFWGEPFSRPEAMIKRSETGDGEAIMAPPKSVSEVSIIKAFPLAELKKIGKIDKNGELFLIENILVIFANRAIYGYDVSTPAAPQELWHVDLKENTEINASRLYNGQIYLISRIALNPYRPCPIELLAKGENKLVINCTDIYHPADYLPADVAYSAMLLNPKTGEVGKTISFIGSYNDSAIYMSPNFIYVAYAVEGDTIKFIYNFLAENKSLVPADVLEKLRKLQEYDLSRETKITELYNIVNKIYLSLTNDERLKLENELNNKMNDYYKDHKRELGQTNIIKISISDFKVESEGSVPGRILNQFSLDEYSDNLRMAVTVGEMNWWGMGFGENRQSANDVYVLDKKLKIIGEIKDLGLEERIYSVRFIGDSGYLVTFKQIDPFYILDLSKPSSPALKGELKIPGFSSYLHPLGNNRILGIGQEEGRVKLSLFDVAAPENPLEIAKYSLDDYWTEVSGNHHAFLLDSKHEVFFLPGGKGGYVFSFKNNSLELLKAIADVQAKRAVYINDNLYILAENKVVVLDESNWEKAGELEL